MTSAGALTKLYSFRAQSGCTDGAGPLAGLVQATDGNFYGTTAGGGANDEGVVFKITRIGGLTTLYSFCSQPSCADGYQPWAGLLQATNGMFYGTTLTGGTSTICPTYGGCGTVFGLATGLHPFVKTQPTSGKEGAKIGILGQGFSSSSLEVWRHTSNDHRALGHDIHHRNSSRRSADWGRDGDYRFDHVDERADIQSAADHCEL